MGKSNRKGEGQYAPLPYGQLKSDAWRSLSGAAVKLFLELHTRYNGGNNGKLTLSFAEAGETLGMGKATVQRAYAELVDRGFLVLMRPGHWYHRRAHEWRITTKPVHTAKGKQAPTNEWRNYRTAKKTKRGSGTEREGGAVVPIENPSSSFGSGPEPVRAVSGTSKGSGGEH